MNIIKKALAILLMIFLIAPISTAYAHDAYFIQSLVNTSNYTYTGTVSLDRNGRFSSERNHAEAQLGDFSGVRNTSNTRGFNIGNIEGEKPTTGDGKKMILTFPGDSDAGSAKSDDYRDADRVVNMLYPSLNSAIFFINDNKQIKSMEELATLTHNLLEGTVPGFSVNYGQRASNERNQMRLPEGIDPDDIVTIRRISTGEGGAVSAGEEIEFIYRVKKSDRENIQITWGHISQQALTAYYHHGFTLATSSEQIKPNALTRYIMGFFQWMISGVTSILGLYTLDELILNSGIRDVTHHYGAYPKSWQNNMSIFYGLFQILAYLILIFAMIKIFLEKNLSTINTSMRVSLMNNLKNLIIAGMILPFSFIFINNIILKPAYLLTEVFVNMGSGSIDSAYSSIGGQAGSFGVVIVQFAYLFIMIYLNIVYIIRAITIALLVATAPIFVASIAINSDFRLFKGYIRELLGNSLLQIIHAMTISFFTVVGTGARTIETLVILYSLIPITKLFKSLLIGSSDTAETMGNQLTGAAVGLTAGAFGGLMAGNKMRGMSKGGQENTASQGAGGNFKSSDSFGGNKFNPEKDFSSMTKHDTKKAMDFKESDPKLKDKSGISIEGGEYAKDSDFKTVGVGDFKIGVPTKDGFKTAMSNKIEDIVAMRKNPKSPSKLGEGLSNFGSSAGSMMTGATMVAAGAGAMIATGSPNMGASLLVKGGGAVAGYGLTKGKDGIGSIRGHIAEKKGNLNSSGFNDEKVTSSILTGTTYDEHGNETDNYQDVDQILYDKSNEYQNILGAELLDNGEVIIARDLESIKAEGEGLRDIVSNSDGTTGFVQDVMVDHEDFQNGYINPTAFGQRMDNNSMREYMRIAQLYNKGDMDTLKEKYGIESISAVRSERRNNHDAKDFNTLNDAGLFDHYANKYPGAISVNKDNGAIDGMFLKINYNEDGLKKMGLSGISKHNGKIFEHKKADDPFATYKVSKPNASFVMDTPKNSNSSNASN